MSNTEVYFHEIWLGMVQPIEGLVVSLPVLVDAQCMERQAPATQQKLLELLAPLAGGSDTEVIEPDEETEVTLAIQNLDEFLEAMLELTPDLFDSGDAIPDDLALYVHEGGQTLKPTLALRKLNPDSEDASKPNGGPTDDSTPASRAGARYEALVWDIPAGLDLDKPETETGAWEYPPSAKLDRLLRHCRVPIGILTNRTEIRLLYAPHGESSGHITFRVTDMATVGGRPILDALVMLLSATRFFGVAAEHSLPALLSESRKRQANVTNELAAQVFEALQILLRGFEAAAERDGRHLLDDALAQDDDHLYQGLLTVLLRMVFVLYAEDRSLLPVDHPIYARSMSALGLFEQLQEDHGAHPDSMARRFGAWSRLLALFRSIYLGVDHGTGPDALSMPPRRGDLFSPQKYPFLEGWGPAGGAPIVQAEDRAAVRVPTLDDLTVFQVLEKLLIFQGQRLSYRTLDVEQIGSVYEALMGYHVIRVPAPAVCLRPSRVWVTAEELLDLPATQRTKWLKDTAGLAKAQATKLAKAIKQVEKSGAPEAPATPEAEIREALAEHSIAGRKKDRSLALAQAGRLVVQPGEERRRTSSHYTPRSLSAPIVARTIEPLLATMGDEPPSEHILDLKICDPAMGSGAFLVEACRFLADHVVAAWTREHKLDQVVAAHEDPVMHARRLVAQRCLYGVDRNASAVALAKLSLWLVTLARDLPFTFLDHSLRHGDSLVGLSFDQIKSFHWKPGKQLELCRKELEAALEEAIALRQQIVDLAHETGPVIQREKERLLFDAEDALGRVRLIGDLIVGAFFAEPKDKARDSERQRRLDRVVEWLGTGGPPPNDLVLRQQELREQIPTFHLMVEYPEIFYQERPDPLEQGTVNRAAYMDAFVGNPPFAAGRQISGRMGNEYRDWLLNQHPGSHGNADYCAYFYRQAFILLGVHGTAGFVSTNTISQGQTRTSGLQVLLSNQAVIYSAETNITWSGSASVTTSLVNFSIGASSEHIGSICLNGKKVKVINSRLEPKVERADPHKLIANTGFASQGTVLSGKGFVVQPDEAASLVNGNSSNGDRIFPFIGGSEVNSDPNQKHNRYVVSFHAMGLEEAEKWPNLIDLVRQRVKPDRDRLRDDNSSARVLKRQWWRFQAHRPNLYNQLSDLDRCLVAAIISKHLMFSFQPTGRIYSHKLYVFPTNRSCLFSVLQSRIHIPWAWLLSSTMKTDMNYSASDCFETFPLPQPDPCTVIPELEEAGQRIYNARAAYMQDPEVWVGLTTTYNRLKDAENDEPRIVALRQLHEEMDRAVLRAYGWQDIEVPPYCPSSDAGHQAIEAFQDEIIDRLFVLNAERAEQERLKGLTAKGGKKGKGSKPGKAKKRSRKSGQADLFGEGGGDR